MARDTARPPDRRQAILVPSPPPAASSAVGAPVAPADPVPGTELLVTRHLHTYASAFLLFLIGLGAQLVPFRASNGLSLIPDTLSSALFLVGALRLVKIDALGSRLTVLAACYAATTAFTEGMIVWNRGAGPSIQEPAIADMRASRDGRSALASGSDSFGRSLQSSGICLDAADEASKRKPCIGAGIGSRPRLVGSRPPPSRRICGRTCG